MYKIVENEDGSTAVYSSKTGELICSVNSKKNPVGIGHPIRRTDNPATPCRPVLQKSTVCTKLNIGLKCSNSVESSNSLNIAVSPVMKDYTDDDSWGEFPPLPSDDEESTAGDFPDDCISQEEFLQCLGVISTRKLEQNSITDLRREFPLRMISRTIPENKCKTQLQVKILEDVEICSPLGIQILQSSSSNELDENGVMACISKCERYCQFSVSSVYCGNVPQLRNRELLTKYPVTYRPLKTWRADSTFQYSFTKKQRQDRFKSLQTGLSRRSRKLKRLCQEVSITLKKLSPMEIKSWLKRKPNSSQSVHINNLQSLNAVGHKPSSVMLTSGPFKSGSNSLKPPLSLVLLKNNPIKAKNRTSEVNNSFSGLAGYGTVKPAFSSVKAARAKLYLPNGKPRLNTSHKMGHNFTSGNRPDDNEDIEILYIKCPSVKNQQSAGACFRNASKSCGGSVMNCSVPLQDVSKQIDRVGGKCFVKGTAIKACGIKGENKGPGAKSILMNNNCINGNCVTSNLLDHAYHRNPLINSTRQLPGIPGKNSAVIPVKNSVTKEKYQDGENIRKIAVPRVKAASPNTKWYSSLLIKKLDASRLPERKYVQTVPSLAHKSNSAYFKSDKVPPMPLSVKVPQKIYSVPQKSSGKQLKHNIQVVDITEDNPSENLSPVKSKPNGLKLMFHCYGCGFRSMFFSKQDFDDAISKHMTQYHSVTEPDSFLNSFFNREDSAIVTEAFPGYKNRGTQ